MLGERLLLGERFSGSCSFLMVMYGSQQTLVCRRPDPKGTKSRRTQGESVRPLLKGRLGSIGLGLGFLEAGTGLLEGL